MLDRLRRSIKTPLAGLLGEAEMLRHALPVLGSRDDTASPPASAMPPSACATAPPASVVPAASAMPSVSAMPPSASVVPAVSAMPPSASVVPAAGAMPSVSSVVPSASAMPSVSAMPPSVIVVPAAGAMPSVSAVPPSVSATPARAPARNGSAASSRPAVGAIGSAVLEALSGGEAMSASEVATATGLGRVTVSSTLSHLAERGEVVKAAGGYQLAGAPPAGMPADRADVSAETGGSVG